MIQFHVNMELEQSNIVDVVTTFLFVPCQHSTITLLSGSTSHCSFNSLIPSTLFPT